MVVAGQEMMILLAHGSRDPRWNQSFGDLTQRLQGIFGPGRLRLAFMELADPNLDGVVADGVADGVVRFVVLPLFLAAGRHLREDVPAAIEKLEAQHPHIAIELLGPIGEHDAMVEAIGGIVSKILDD